MKQIFAFPLNRFGEIGYYRPGNDVEGRLTGPASLWALAAQGDSVTHCATRTDAREKAREAAATASGNKSVNSLPLYKESISKHNRESNYNQNQFEVNRKVKSQNYLKGIARDARGRRIWGTWAPDRLAYQSKFKVFSVMLQAEQEGIPPLDGAWLALNAGVSLFTVLPGVCRWVKSGHICIYIRYKINEQGMTVIDTKYSKTNRYELTKKGKHMLKKIRSMQPVWCAARDAELTQWNEYIGERLAELGNSVHAAHTILKEMALE